jgi:outer membrane biosynthesis protein TonB
MTNEKQNKVKGIIGTIAFHGLLLLALILIGLSTPLPLPGEEGVEVNLGYTDQGMGKIQKVEPAPAKVIPPPPEPEKEVKEKIITQDVEEAPAIEEKKIEEKKPEKKPEVKPKEIKKEVVPEKKEPEPPKVNPKALYKGKSNAEGQGGSEGETNQPGDQGSPYGDPKVSNHEGTGGQGNGISYSLGGRGAMNLPKPEYNSEDQGKVVVTIKVDQQGNVTSADPGAKGTNVSDHKLWEMAKEAALKSKFSPDPNAPPTQTGTITYNFIRLN